MKKDLTSILRDGGYAVYLPAISGFYTKTLGKNESDPNWIDKNRIPHGFEKGIEALDFLKEDAYFHYAYGLYSAGHAQLDIQKSKISEQMIMNRDRTKTTILADSGGFQIATGVLKFDWNDFKSKAADEIRMSILRWMEEVSDYAMTLDVPAFAATPRLSKKTGIKTVEQTLEYSIHNLHFFMQNRIPGKTKMLNVLSGTTKENAKTWYEEVKHFSNPTKVQEMGYDPSKTLEGYAFAGINMRTMQTTLERILDLRDEGLLQDKEWIHFLGVGRLDWACYLTSIKRAINKYINPKLQISYDAASPFVSTAYGLTYSHNYFNPKRWGYNMEKSIDNRTLKGNTSAMPFGSPIMDRLTVGDICCMGDAHALINGERVFDITEEETNELIKQGINASWVPADTNKNGKIARTSWDVLSYAFIMAHNVYNHIHSTLEANRLTDHELLRLKNKLSYKDWKILKRNEIDSISPYVPSNILYFDNFVDTLLNPNTKDPRKMIEDYKTQLDSIGFGKQSVEINNNLFEDATEIGDMDEKYVDLNDEKLTGMENDFDE